MSTKRKNIKGKMVKRVKSVKTQKGGYKYSGSPSLDSLSEEIKSFNSNNKSYKNKRILKTRKRSQHKSRK